MIPNLQITTFALLSSFFIRTEPAIRVHSEFDNRDPMAVASELSVGGSGRGSVATSWHVSGGFGGRNFIGSVESAGSGGSGSGGLAQSVIVKCHGSGGFGSSGGSGSGVCENPNSATTAGLSPFDRFTDGSFHLSFLCSSSTLKTISVSSSILMSSFPLNVDSVGSNSSSSSTTAISTRSVSTSSENSPMAVNGSDSGFGSLLLKLEDKPTNLRAAERGGYGGERYEKLEFQKKVAESYKVLHDVSWKVIDACQPIEDVEKQLQEIVLDCVTECQKGNPLSPLLWSK